MARTANASEAIRAVIGEAMASDPGLTVVRETPGVSSGGPTPDVALPEGRVTVVPIADRAAAAFAVGLALGGSRTVLELAGSERLPAIVEVLVEAASIAAGDEFPVPLLVRVPYGAWPAGERGAGACAATLVSSVPGLRVVCPSTPALAAALARWALQARRPVVLLEPVALAEMRGDIGDDAATAIPSQGGSPSAGLVRRGTHATVAAWGAGVGAAIEAAAAVAREGIDVDVVDVVSLSPLDRVTLGARVRATGRLVVAHPDEPLLAARIREVALEEAFLFLEAPLADAAVPRGGGEPIAAAVRRAVHF